jgi:NAD+ kinase
MKVRFCANAAKPAAKSAVRKLEAAARRAGLGVAAKGRADIVIALGGDGTILRTAREFRGAPVLGFNLGSLGYLAAVGESEFDSALALLASGRWRISERTVLEAAGPRGERAAAINDIVVAREMSGHAAVLELEVDGRSATRYAADGVVVATPTGSTAYSLASGGPVVMPDSRSFVVTPINPHALGVRPMVVGDGVRIAVTSRRRVNGVAEKIGVYADGETAFKLGGDETVEISKSPATAKFVELEGYDPYEVLSRKLGWSGRARQ